MKQILITILMLFLFSPIVLAKREGAALTNYLKKQKIYISKTDAEGVIKKLVSIYQPIFKKRRYPALNVKFNYRKPELGARAKTLGRKSLIVFDGGILRHPQSNTDVLALILCHEIGHHLGGLPKKYDVSKGVDTMSAEAQADYFSSSKCMRRYLKGMNNIEVLKKIKIPVSLTRKCQQVWGIGEDSAICIRTAWAGVVEFNIQRKLRAIPGMVSANKMDKTITKKTMANGYPGDQCRLDSLIQGALCKKGVEEIPTSKVDDEDSMEGPAMYRVTKKDADQGYCSRDRGYKIGVRPLCWYNPRDWGSIPDEEEMNAFWGY